MQISQVVPGGGSYRLVVLVSLLPDDLSLLGEVDAAIESSGLSGVSTVRLVDDWVGLSVSETFYKHDINISINRKLRIINLLTKTRW